MKIVCSPFNHLQYKFLVQTSVHAWMRQHYSDISAHRHTLPFALLRRLKCVLEESYVKRNATTLIRIDSDAGCLSADSPENPVKHNT